MTQAVCASSLQAINGPATRAASASRGKLRAKRDALVSIKSSTCVDNIRRKASNNNRRPASAGLSGG